MTTSVQTNLRYNVSNLPSKSVNPFSRKLTNDTFYNCSCITPPETTYVTHIRTKTKIEDTNNLLLAFAVIFGLTSLLIMYKLLQHYFNSTKSNTSTPPSSHSSRNLDDLELQSKKKTPIISPWLTKESLEKEIEIIKKHPHLIDHLWAIVEKSKTLEGNPDAAARAISILHALHTPFRNRDLSGIKIPGAYLPGIDFTKTRLDRANLERVFAPNIKLDGSSINNVDATGFIIESVSYPPHLLVVCQANPNLIAQWDSEKNEIIITNFESDQKQFIFLESLAQIMKIHFPKPHQLILFTGTTAFPITIPDFPTPQIAQLRSQGRRSSFFSKQTSILPQNPEQKILNLALSHSLNYPLSQEVVGSTQSEIITHLPSESTNKYGTSTLTFIDSQSGQIQKSIQLGGKAYLFTQTDQFLIIAARFTNHAEAHNQSKDIPKIIFIDLHKQIELNRQIIPFEEAPDKGSRITKSKRTNFDPGVKDGTLAARALSYSESSHLLAVSFNHHKIILYDLSQIQSAPATKIGSIPNTSSSQLISLWSSPEQPHITYLLTKNLDNSLTLIEIKKLNKGEAETRRQTKISRRAGRGAAYSPQEAIKGKPTYTNISSAKPDAALIIKESTYIFKSNALSITNLSSLQIEEIRLLSPTQFFAKTNLGIAQLWSIKLEDRRLESELIQQHPHCLSLKNTSAQNARLPLRVLELLDEFNPPLIPDSDSSSESSKKSESSGYRSISTDSGDSSDSENSRLSKKSAAKQPDLQKSQTRGPGHEAIHIPRSRPSSDDGSSLKSEQWQISDDESLLNSAGEMDEAIFEKLTQKWLAEMTEEISQLE